MGSQRWIGRLKAAAKAADYATIVISLESNNGRLERIFQHPFDL